MPREKNGRKYFRLYCDILNDPKIVSLSDARFKSWINLLCVCHDYPDSQISDSDMAWRLRLTKDEWLETKAVFVCEGLCDEANKATYHGLYQASLRLPAAEWALLRKEVFARDDYTCTYCGERGKVLECDHIIPVTRGGSHDIDNLTTACKPCNQSKRDKIVSIEEFSAKRRAAK